MLNEKLYYDNVIKQNFYILTLQVIPDVKLSFFPLNLVAKTLHI